MKMECHVNDTVPVVDDVSPTPTNEVSKDTVEKPRPPFATDVPEPAKESKGNKSQKKKEKRKRNKRKGGSDKDRSKETTTDASLLQLNRDDPELLKYIPTNLHIYKLRKLEVGYDIWTTDPKLNDFLVSVREKGSWSQLLEGIYNALDASKEEEGTNSTKFKFLTESAMCGLVSAITKTDGKLHVYTTTEQAKNYVSKNFTKDVVTVPRDYAISVHSGMGPCLNTLVMLEGVDFTVTEEELNSYKDKFSKRNDFKPDGPDVDSDGGEKEEHITFLNEPNESDAEEERVMRVLSEWNLNPSDKTK